MVTGIGKDVSWSLQW